ncbi:hypothetical protein LRS06_16060 [Hymenobacter sp. J193]|uniref:hypothetical protein n=1 Tax=Hymenobacter sp. J193 TaxID=2898429 RepID=UPI0021507F3E|nr:hypothetical protein [Hymenobacter sp. J193]MCR5889252.1 hypothetical protein [Hymenobacter sp. J193]
MLLDLIDRYSTATISVAQTTYMILEVEGGKIRVDFREKAEAILKPGRGGALTYYTHHPLLDHYNEDKTTIYINSPPNDPEALYIELQQAIASSPQKWVDTQSAYANLDFKSLSIDYTIGKGTIKEVLIQGKGMLLSSVPPSIANRVLAACEKHRLATKTFSEPNPNQYSLLSIGPSYVIAKGFAVHQLQ